MSRIYVASSWRNTYQPNVVKVLRDQLRHEVYDFHNPPGKAGFKWADIEVSWQSWTMERYRELLTTTPDASFGFIADYRAMQWADTCVLVLPCGRSAHLEAGYFNGSNKRLIIYIPEPIEPDLMYLMANHICLTMDEVLDVINR
jgi:hypothetical protein